MSGAALMGRVLLEGAGEGVLLRLGAPLSFWGGVDPATGLVIDARHPDRGRDVSGTVLAIEAPIGSSSSSAVMLELIRKGKAPAAVILGRADAILVVGCLVAREMGMRPPPVVEVAPEMIAGLAPGRYRVDADGRIGPAAGATS